MQMINLKNLKAIHFLKYYDFFGLLVIPVIFIFTKSVVAGFIFYAVSSAVLYGYMKKNIFPIFFSVFLSWYLYRFFLLDEPLAIFLFVAGVFVGVVLLLLYKLKPEENADNSK